MQTCAQFQKFFVVHGRDSSGHAQDYLRGLLSRFERKSIGRIDEELAQSNYQGMQQFISDSPWSEKPLMAEICAQANGILGGHPDCALYLDETSFVKKGNASVGVKKQYCGRLGKLENCQVGVFAAMGRGERVALVDQRLFLPEDWAQDAQRCAKAKVPPGEREHRSKPRIALDLVREVRQWGSTHRWVGGDAVYGENRELTDGLEAMGEVFLMDIKSNHWLWGEHPQPVLDEAPSTQAGQRGRPRVGVWRAGNAQARKQTSGDWVKAQFEEHAREIIVRQTTQGELRVRVWVRSVWQWSGDESAPRSRWLVVRQEADGSYKYSLSNAPANTTWRRLAFMQAQRYWIERAFEDAKSELGMAHYEVRGWRGWHHHMALVCLAMLFTLKQRIAFAAEVPLLSVRDVVELLEHFLPRPLKTQAEVLAAMSKRHRARASASASARKRKIITK